MLLLAGCAALPFGKSGDAKAAEGPPEPVVGPPAYRVEVAAPRALRELLLGFLDIARFQKATDADSINSAELDRLVATTPAQARGLIETEGYFNAEVEARRIAATAPGELPVVQVRVDPGPRTRVAKVDIAVSGELQDLASAGDSVALRQRQQFRDDWPLPVGEPFRDADWGSAKNGSLARLRADGYAAATWESTQATVNAPANEASLALRADSGPLYRLGEVRVEGLQIYSESAVRNLATFGPGTPYREKLLLDYQERLQRATLFEGVIVELDADPATAKTAPVLVRLREMPLQQATFGVGYSDQTGERVTFEHTHRRVFNRSFFGSDWIAKNKFALGRDRQSWEGDLTSHPLEGGYRRLVGANVQRQVSLDSLIVSARLRAGRSFQTERLEKLAFAELLAESDRSDVLQQSVRAASGNFHFVWRNVDNVLLPTRGYSLSGETGAGYALATRQENGPFARGLGRLTVYQPLGDWFGSGRIQVGQVFAGQNVGVPDALEFRAGGDDSVRGYEFRSLGPLVQGKVTGGRVLMTASAELARPIPQLPSIWWATFIDAGNAAADWGSLKPRFGAGVGVRVRSPVGPLRFDIAYGEAVREIRLHLSAGIVF